MIVGMAGKGHSIEESGEINLPSRAF